MTFAPRHLLLLLCAAALMSLTACHQRGGFENQDEGGTTIPLQLPFANLPTPQVGDQVNIALVASGGSGIKSNYVWQLVSSPNSTLDPALQVLPSGFIFGTASQARNYKPIFRVMDTSTMESVEQQFNFAVADATGTVPNIGPSFNTTPGPADTVHVSNSLYEFQFGAIDADGDPLTFTFSSISERNNNPVTGTLPFIDASGKFSWDQMPDGTYDLQISASDGTNNTPFFWCVTTYTPPAPAPLPCNQPPMLSVGIPPMATQGQAFKFRVTASDPENDNLQWSLIFPSSGNIANNMVVNQLPDSRLADIDWTPSFAQTPGLYQVTVRVADTAGNIATSLMQVQLQAGPPQPSNIRVFTSGILAPTGAAHSKASDIRGFEELDPAMPDMHSFMLTGATQLDFRDFGRGASSLALTGPKHGLRIGAQRAREVYLGTTSTYIQLPTYTTIDQGNSPQTEVVSARLYHGTNEESLGFSGTQDFIAAFDTLGYARVFEFGENIMEEIYVPFHFQELPYFVVTADSGQKMWICRLDGRNFTGTASPQLELNIAGIGADTVLHQTVTGTLNRAQATMQASQINFTHLNLWFAATGAAMDSYHRVLGDSSGAGTPPQSTQVMLDTSFGTAPTRVSTYFCPSGDSRRVAIVAGDNMTTTIGTSDDMVNFGQSRDVWMLDGEMLTTKRLTDFSDAANRPMAGPDTRLIDVFDSNAFSYKENFPNAMAKSDLGGNDRRVIFAEPSDSSFNSQAVGHTMNYDGTLVGFVLLEANSGSTDGGSDGIRDEVYVCGVDSANSHDIIRVTASPSATDTAGTRLGAASDFQINMGVVMGLSFPSLSGTKGRNNRLFFSAGMNQAMSLIEHSTVIYTAEFGVSGTNDISHVSTADRTTGNVAPANGFEVPDHETEYRVFGGSAEGADSGNDTGVYTFLYFEGNTTINPTGSIVWLDNTLPNSSVTSTNPSALLSKYVDADDNPISVYRLASSRTMYSSNREQGAPFGGGQTSRFQIAADLFKDVPGTGASGSVTTRVFVAAESSNGNETVYAMNMGVPNDPVVDLSNLVGQGRIHDLAVSNDGDSIALYLSASPASFGSHRYGTSIQACEIYIVPSVTFALAENAAPLAKTYSATQVGTGAYGGFTGRGGVWVDTSTTSSADTREFWFAVGNSSSPSTTSITNELTGVRIPTTRVSGMTPTVGTTAAIDSSIMAADLGSVTFYGSGVRK